MNTNKKTFQSLMQRLIDRPQPFRFSESDSDSEFEDEYEGRREHMFRQFSILAEHDTFVFNQWRQLVDQNQLLQEQNQLFQEMQIQLQVDLHLAHQREIKLNQDAIKSNEMMLALQKNAIEIHSIYKELYATYNELREKNESSASLKVNYEQLISSLQSIIESGSTQKEMVYRLQQLLTKDQIRKNGYVDSEDDS